jgi:hypothetical protein
MPLRRWLCLLAFVAVFAGHVAWLSRPAATGCLEDSQGNKVKLSSVTPPVYCPTGAGFSGYLENQDYWLGLSYALAAAFTVFALARWRNTRTGAVAGALTGVSFTAALAAFGCFMFGCCGSPMLPVWIGLFGARGLHLAKPIVAGLTIASLGVGYLLMLRKCGSSCGCHAPARPSAPVTLRVVVADRDHPSPPSAQALATVNAAAQRFAEGVQVVTVALDDPSIAELGLSLEPTVFVNELAVGVGQAPALDYLIKAIEHAQATGCGCADGECCS